MKCGKNRHKIQCVDIVQSSKNFETINKKNNNGAYDWNSDNNNCNNSNGSNGSGNVEVNVYNSNDSVHSTSEKETAVIFFGFEDSWERDLWSLWLLEVSEKFF